ncbi:universal stress protein [Mycolicibacterium sp. P1-5]|uniref:universal stress protein n=1 Tax=Mycolicibacterium sp. P1-5 TaxID=2024617 RepID=UPI0011EE9F41|nr:universal stress protein [Mycolicibacterium sp. P1-5]KAA0107543.1 universal stress protein [Mycolicibacterium sp. P1-5]
MPEPFTPPSIVVGVDGSRGAVRAALWAIEEAVSRDIPLRLLYAIDPSSAEEADAQAEARQLAGAELAVRHAAGVVEATERPVKVEIDVLYGRPIATLVQASRWAALICVGEVGLKHFDADRIGSTATALVTSARCPVAIVRGGERSMGHDEGWIVVELDESPDSAAVLQFAVEEARVRRAPLRVLGSWQSRYTDVHDSHAVSDGNRMIRAQLDRRLSHWKSRYPDLDARPVAIHGSVLNYLAKHSGSIQLVVVGARNPRSIEELLGPTGSAALHNTDCSVLVVDRQRLL